ncbi:MAG: ABC transporter ATP-binding protein [Alphaproteobacteria bacterium]|nr:MAG: ABC transporter ATP-binding protein [Alphaproteobacteria bacterium]
MSSTADAALELAGIRMTYRQGNTALDVLRGIDLALRPGEVTALVGPSGSGKSTLLHIAGLLERPTAGKVIIGGRDATGLADRERTRIRRHELGFVYQFHHLLPEFTALENIVIAQLIAGVDRDTAGRKALDLLARVGLADRANHRPAELSGGEQQRVAIMRALANDPRILLADEPTGNLDDTTSGHVMMELLNLARDRGVAALIATHNRDLASRMDRIVALRAGLLHEAGSGGERSGD